MAQAQEKQEKINRDQLAALELTSKTQMLDQEFEELLLAVRRNFMFFEAEWTFAHSSSSDDDETEVFKIDMEHEESKSDAEFFDQLRHEFFMLLFDLKEAAERGRLVNAPSKQIEYPHSIVPAVKRLTEIKGDLSPSKATKFDYLGIASISDSLHALADDRWWVPSGGET